MTQLHALARQITVQLRRDNQPIGSGVWLSSKGYVATCSHVLDAAQGGEITVLIGGENVYEFGAVGVLRGGFFEVSATTLLQDKIADVAMLKTAETEFPQPGSVVVIAGYPLEALDLITQTGNFAGTTLLNPPSPPTTPPSKKIRLLLSLVSNPGNSGGPILNGNGKLIGLLEGNLNAPMRDSSGL